MASPGPKRSWFARFVRRPLRVLGWIVLALVVLLVVVWFFRQQLLVPLLRPRLERAVATALGAQRVSIGAFEGNWLDELDVRGIDIEGARAPLREVRGARIVARYSLWALLGGDLSALRSAQVTAVSVQIDLRPEAATRPRTDAAFDIRSYEPLLRLFPDGATVHVDRLDVLAAHGERQGPLDVSVRAGAAARELVLAYPGLHVTAQVHGVESHGAGERIEAQLDADDPGALLDLFGLGASVREGKLHAEVTATLEPPRLAARFDLSDLVHEGRRLERSQIVARLDADVLAIDRATIDLPGLAAEVRELTLPNPFGSAAVSLQQLAGQFSVRVLDLEPHVALLPERLRLLLPIRGELAGSFADGLLHLDRCELQGRGAVLQLEQGSFPLASGDWQAAAGSVRFLLTLAQFATDLPSLGETSFSGSLAGTVAGSLAEPRLEMQLDLGECGCERGSLTSAAGLVRADRGSLAIEGLRVLGLSIPALGSAAATSVELDANCRLRDGRIDPDSLVGKLDLGSEVPAALLAPLFAEHGLGPAPVGVATLHFEGRHDASGLVVTALRVRTSADSPLDVAIDGEGTLPLRWAGAGAVTALAAGSLTLRASAKRPAVGTGEPAMACHGTLRLGARSVELRSFELLAGTFTLRGEGSAQRGVAAFVEPGAFAETPFAFALDLDELDLATLPVAWTGAARLQGRASGHVSARGTGRTIEPQVELAIDDGALIGEGLPLLTGARVRLEATTAAEPTRALVLVARLSAALDQQLGLEPSLALEAKVRCDETGTTLEPTVLRIGGGELAIELRSNLRRSDLLGGTVERDQLTLAGQVALRDFALEKLPEALLGIGPVRGIVSGEVVVDGPLGPSFGPAFVRTANLTLRDGDLKIGDMPRLEQLAAEITCDQQALTLRSLSGLLGAGRFTAQGSLQAGGHGLAAGWADSQLDARLDGEDVLLYRGDGAKARATVHMVASGTPRDLAISGEVVLGRGSKYVRRISLIPDLRARGGENVSEGLHLVELPPEIGDRVTLDVAIKTEQSFEVRTDVFDGEVDVAAHLRGKGSAPRIEGTLALRSGMLRFPGMNLRIVSGLLTFTRAEPHFPELLVQAEGRRMGISVTLMITGRYDRPEVQISSLPPLPPQDLIVLLTTGQLPSTLVERQAEGHAQFVGGYLAKEVLEKWFGSDSTERGDSALDRLTIETGREVSKNGTESVLIEYELSPKLALQVQRDAYEDFNIGIVLRFRFR